MQAKQPHWQYISCILQPCEIQLYAADIQLIKNILPRNKYIIGNKHKINDNNNTTNQPPLKKQKLNNNTPKPTKRPRWCPNCNRNGYHSPQNCIYKYKQNNKPNITPRTTKFKCRHCGPNNSHYTNQCNKLPTFNCDIHGPNKSHNTA